MSLITMPNGERRPMDSSNYRAVAREYIQQNRDRGRGIDEAATLDAFKAQAGEQPVTFIWNPGTGGESYVNAPAARVLGMPFVRAADWISDRAGELVSQAKDAAAGVGRAAKVWSVAAGVATVGAAVIAGVYLLRKK